MGQSLLRRIWWDLQIVCHFAEKINSRENTHEQQIEHSRDTSHPRFFLTSPMQAPPLDGQDTMDRMERIGR